MQSENTSTKPVREMMTPVPEEDALIQVHPLPIPQPTQLPTVQSWEPRSDGTSEEFLHYGVTLYKAALSDDWETVKRIWMESSAWICTRITKGGETVLHIAAATKHVQLVKGLVDIMDADHLALTNKVGNTALCFAAASGVVDIADLMVKKNNALPNIRGSHGMTPLHMAALLGHGHMVKYLLQVTDDEQLSDHDRIGLLTSLIKTDLLELALCYLDSKPRLKPRLAVLRDGKKETALHVLARKPLKPGCNEFNMCPRFKMPWNRSTQGNKKETQAGLKLAQMLWDEIIKQKHADISKLIGDPWRLLFVAAELGKVEFLMVLIKSYPDVIWKVDENRYSIFHIAVIHRYDEIFKLIYEIGAIKDLIATYKDDNKNNMLHLAAKLAPPSRLQCVSGAALQMKREIIWFEAVKRIVRPDYTEAENKDHQTPQTLFTEEHKHLRTEGEAWMKKTAESCALVATLIATMVFSAAFQLPGGFNSTTGSPVLVKRACFMLFALSNAVSLFTSTASILMFLSILTSRYAEKDFRKSLPVKLMSGLILLYISIATMIVAFTTTFFITFREGASWTSIPIALIASIPVALFSFQQFPLLMDIYRSTYKSKYMFQTSKPKLFQRLSQRKTHYPFSKASLAPNTVNCDFSHQLSSLIVDPVATDFF